MEPILWNALQAIAAILQAIALFTAGCWAYFRFLYERTHIPHIEFGIHCNFYGPEGEHYIAEILIKPKNNGTVLQRFQKLTLRVRGIPHDPELKLWHECKSDIEHKYRLFFPLQLKKEKGQQIKEINVIPEDYKPYFVEPGCEETIVYITRVPKDWKYLLVHAKYLYDHADRYKKEAKKKWRTAERMFQVDVSLNHFHKIQ